MPLTLIDRFHPRLRKEQQEAINEGNLRKLEEAELLEPAQLRPLAKLSLLMLVIGGAFFGVLNIAAYDRQTHATGGGLGGWGLFLWFAVNILGYILILPIHELIHGAAFALWGGKPYFGTKLPYALYCGAKQQLFRRNQYLVVGLAPLVLITLAGIIFTLVSPALASYTIFATVGNVAGAAGDVLVAWRLLQLPDSVLVEDTEAGYRVWEVTPLSSHEMLSRNSHQEKEILMANNENTQPMHMPTPDPALKRLEKLVGTWELKGRTLHSKEDNITGWTTFEWMPGGFFLQSVGEITFNGSLIHSLELITYDPERKTFPSSVYSNLSGTVLSYEWDIQGNTVIHSGLGSKYTGTFSEDGTMLSGGWRPDEGTKSTDGNAYDAVMTRIK